MQSPPARLRPAAVVGRDPHLGHAAHQPTVADLTDDARLAAVRTALDSTAQWQGSTTLINFVGRADMPSAVAGSWSAEQRDRLVKTRKQHDPYELFAFPPEAVDQPSKRLPA